MPKQIKKPAAGRFVEVSLKIAKKKFPLISEALKAVMALAGQPDSLGLSEKKSKVAKTKTKTKTSRPPRAGRDAKSPPIKSARSRPPAEKSPIPPETAALIRDLRTKAGLSQKALAVKVGASQNHISLLETVKQRLKPALAKKLSRVFNAQIPS